jgi:hypothetical protein
MSNAVDTLTHEILSDFLRHGRYLRNWGARTVETYDFILSSAVGTSLTKAGLNAHAVTLRERGLATATINIRLRALTSLLGWLHEDGRTAERLRVKLLRAEQRMITILSDNDVRKLTPTGRPAGRRRASGLIFHTGDSRRATERGPWESALRLPVTEDQLPLLAKRSGRLDTCTVQGRHAGVLLPGGSPCVCATSSSRSLC